MGLSIDTATVNRRNEIKPYSTYKQSGIGWLGDVPSHWHIGRLKNTVQSVQSGVWGEDPQGDGKDIVCIRVADFDRVARRVDLGNLTLRSVDPQSIQKVQLEKGNLLIEKSGGGEVTPVGMVVMFDHDIEAVFSNFIAKFNVKHDYDPTFLNYVHAALYMLGANKPAIKQTTGIQNLDLNQYLNTKFACPPLPEQRAIARYLEFVDDGIQRYIKAKERLIELLEEQKRAVINQAVTRGLDPDVPLKPSGVEWLGDIPAHWEVGRLKFLATKFGSGITPRGGASVYQETGIPFLRSQNVHFDGLRIDGVARD